MGEIKFKKIGVARELESPENPDALESRVILVPNDVKRLVDFGCEVSVEQSAGVKMGYLDKEYQTAGADVVSHDDLYSKNELVIKLKGPALDDITKMQADTTLFCMAHVLSFPKRRALFEKHRINVLAMEKLLESPQHVPYDRTLGVVAILRLLRQLTSNKTIYDIYYLGWTPRISGAIKRGGSPITNFRLLLPENTPVSKLPKANENTIFVLDSSSISYPDSTVAHINAGSARVLDLNEFERAHPTAVEEYMEKHPPKEFGLRRIQSLNETGRAGARYGIELLLKTSKTVKSATDINVVTFGYGNVGMGGIEECYSHRVKQIAALGRQNTATGRIEDWIANADLIINGAEQPVQMRGKNYILTRDHTKNLLKKGSVVIDLVGGRADNRSAVENVIECTYLNDPYFVEDGVYFSALWGWPMMGFQKETTERYSKQVTSALIEQEMIIYGLEKLPKAAKLALVVG